MGETVDQLAQISRNVSREWCHDRLHYRNNHQEEERQLKDTTPLALGTTSSKDIDRHHDPPEVAVSFKTLQTEESRGAIWEAKQTVFYMSTPESPAKVEHFLPPEENQNLPDSVKEKRRQLGDMQTSTADAKTPASDQDPEFFFIWSLPSKRRKLVDFTDGPRTNITLDTILAESLLKAEALTPEACEDSGLTAEQHMADLDSSKSSTLEDIDSAAHLNTILGASRAPHQLSPDKQVGENVEQVSEQRELDLQLSSQQNAPESSQGIWPRYEETQFASHYLSPEGRVRMDLQDIVPTRQTESESVHQTPRLSSDMASGSDEWLQLSLGGGQSEIRNPDPIEAQEGLQSHTVNPQSTAPSGSSQPDNLLVDFFKVADAENVGVTRHFIDVQGSTLARVESSAYKEQRMAAYAGAGGESSMHYSGDPEPSHRSASGSFFLESGGGDPSLGDPTVHILRMVPPMRGQVPSHASGVNTDQFVSPSPILQKGYLQPYSSTSTGLPWNPARVLQPVRSQQTETTSVNAWRSHQAIDASGAGPSSIPYYDSQTRLPLPGAPSIPLSWISHHDPPQTLSSLADTLRIPSQRAFRDWRLSPISTIVDVNPGTAPSSFLSIQPPHAQSVDPEQAWRNLLQRVGSNLNVPSGFPSAASSQRPVADSMMPPHDSQEYVDALKRAVDRFQGIDQVPKEEPLTDLQLLHRTSMFPPTQRSHLGPSFDPSTDINLSRFFNTPSSSGSKPRVTTSSSERQKRTLRPVVRRPGLWLTLRASESQPGASPLQQIPTAYIRVIDDNMTVAAVKKYLVNKLGLSNDDEVDLTCKGQPLVPSLPLIQVRDGIWKSSITTPESTLLNPRLPQLMIEGKARKSMDGVVTFVEDVVMVLTYGRRRPQEPLLRFDTA